MSALDHREIFLFFVSLSLLLGLARLLGEAFRRIHQPAVIGELLAGLLLGPTILGRINPEWQLALFPMDGGSQAAALEGLTLLAVALFLLVAGMEVDLSMVWRQGKAALSVAFAGMVIPFALGFALAWLFPRFLGHEGSISLAAFALFFATALSISAVPVIAKILMDLNLYKTDLGMIVIASAILNDLVGWIIFAMILGMLGSVQVVALPITSVILLTLGFTVIMLTLVRWGIDRTLPWIQAHASWPGGVLGFVFTGTMIAAATTEWIGIHAIFGAFMFGIALGDSRHLRERTRATIEQFVSFIFIPIFFASIGLKVDFIANFDWGMVLVVLVVATVGKVLGSAAGARLAGMPKRESLAIGAGMNARGAMEIILGLLALNAGLIGQKLFVALVVMALVTSIMSGTMMQKLLQRKRKARLIDFLSPAAYISSLAATECHEAIKEISIPAAKLCSLKPHDVAKAVWHREQLMSTALPNQVATPHARIAGLKKPVVILARSENGIDFNARDGQPSRLILLLLTPERDPGIQLELLADTARLFMEPRMVDQALSARSYTEILALIKSHEPVAKS